MISCPVLAFGLASLLMTAVAVLFVLSSLALTLIILIQKGKGGGLSAAFGGGMAGGLLGSKTGDFLTWVTIVFVSIFLGLGVLMAKFYRPAVSDFGTDQAPKQQQPAETRPASAPGQNPPATTSADSDKEANAPAQ